MCDDTRPAGRSVGRHFWVCEQAKQPKANSFRYLLALWAAFQTFDDLSAYLIFSSVFDVFEDKVHYYVYCVRVSTFRKQIKHFKYLLSCPDYLLGLAFLN